MLPFKNRLTKRKDFEVIYKKGSFLKGKSLSIRWILNGQPESRIGFSVSTKFSKKAVERNRIKRQLRDIVKNSFLGKFKKGFDLTISPIKNKESALFKAKELEKELERCLREAGLLNNN